MPLTNLSISVELLYRVFLGEPNTSHHLHTPRGYSVSNLTHTECTTLITARFTLASFPAVFSLF